MRSAFNAGTKWHATDVFEWIYKNAKPEWRDEFLAFSKQLAADRRVLWVPWDIRYHCKKLRDVRMTRARAIVGQKIYADAVGSATADEFSKYVTEQMVLLSRVKPL